MIFNQNITERSRRILFDNGFCLIDREVCKNKTSDKADASIGKTLYACGHYLSNSEGYEDRAIICTVDPVDITNISEIAFFVEQTQGTRPRAYWRLGVANAESVDNSQVGKYVGISNAHNDPINSETLNRYTEEPSEVRVDVSDLAGDYYIYIYATGSGSDYYNDAKVSVSEVWTV
jgi:hypothetical protein